MWVRVVRERRLYPTASHRVCVHFLPGLAGPIRRAWGEALIRDGDAVEVPTPPRPNRSSSDASEA
jgi:hypothetical protein